MTFLTLNATPQSRPGSGQPLNLTTLLADGALGSNSGVEFMNSGREVLYVQQGTAASTITVTIGATVEGQAVNSIQFSGVASDIVMIGPFNSDFDVQPGSLVQVTFGTPADVTGVALVSNVGAY